MTYVDFPTDVIGPYSPWPRRRSTFRTRAAAGAGVAAAAAFVHFIVPMI